MDHQLPGDTPGPDDTVQLALTVARDGQGRFEGSVRPVGTAEPVPFSGTLELLRVLENVLDDDQRTAAQPRPAEPPDSESRPRSTSPDGTTNATAEATS